MRRLSLIAFALMATSAHAAMTISNANTKNVTCTGGVCTPTSGNANLNIGDLQTMLASSNVTVKSSASTPTLGVLDPLTWASTHRLTLDSYQSIHVKAPVVVEGTSGLTLTTNDGGTGGDYEFDTPGTVTFWDTASILVINGQSFKLEKDIRSLASDMAQYSSVNYALAATYDASADGAYTDTPIPVTLFGAFEGLGNSIQNLAINARNRPVGFFDIMAGSVRDLILENEQIDDANGTAGALASHSTGTVSSVKATGSVRAGCAGGLIGINDGTILNSGASVTTQGLSVAGGLVCVNEGTIAGSFATGQVAGAAQAGGLIGNNYGPVYQSFSAGSVFGTSIVGGLIGIAGNQPHAGSVVADCYSTAKISGAQKSAGGLIGEIHAPRLAVRTSFAAGKVSAQGNSIVGGAFGTDSARSNNAVYWDLGSTGISNPHQGAGQPLDDPGITGLTNAQLKSALPSGFDPTVWAQNVNINNGWPYLLANPPPQ